MKKSIIAALMYCISIITTNIHANDDNSFITTDSKLYYEIGGAKRISPPIISGHRSNVNLGLGGNVNLGYSCGNFEFDAAFKNLMNGFKNGANSVKNTLVNGVKAGISSLPLATLQRAMPDVYDMFQEWSAEANAQIEVASKSCEQIEAELANGGDPYSDFFSISKAQDFKDMSYTSTDIVATKQEIEKNAGDNGITTFGGNKAGGVGQQPLRVTHDTILAGYNYAVGNNNPTNNINAPANSEISKYFTNSTEAAQFATEVIGEYEINNKEPNTVVGLGLYPQIEKEREVVYQEFSNDQWNNLGIGETVRQKLKNISPAEYEEVIYSNILDDIATKRVIKKALITRRLLLNGSQDPHAHNDLTQNQIDKMMIKLNSDIESVMFERRINSELANSTMSKLLETDTRIGNRNNSGSTQKQFK